MVCPVFPAESDIVLYLWYRLTIENVLVNLSHEAKLQAPLSPEKLLQTIVAIFQFLDFLQKHD